MIIDSHQHFWKIGKHDHEWPQSDLKPIYADFGVDEWLNETQGLSLSGTVLVQSQPSHNDTHFLLDLATHHDLILGVVGYVDMSSPQALETLDIFRQNKKFVGIRPMLQSISRDDWILNPQFDPIFKALIAHNLCFDALIYTRHIQPIITLARRYPDLKIIIDHGAKPPIASASAEAHSEWQQAMTKAADCPNIEVKLSGLWTEMAPDQTFETITVFVDHLWLSFGPKRLMWGSDWPVIKLKASYQAWYDWVMTYVTTRDLSALSDIFAMTAIKTYRLNLPFFDAPINE